MKEWSTYQPEQWFSKRDPQASRISMACKLVRHAKSPGPPQPLDEKLQAGNHQEGAGLRA